MVLQKAEPTVTYALGINATSIFGTKGAGSSAAKTGVYTMKQVKIAGCISLKLTVRKNILFSMIMINLEDEYIFMVLMI